MLFCQSTRRRTLSSKHQCVGVLCYSDLQGIHSELSGPSLRLEYYFTYPKRGVFNVIKHFMTRDLYCKTSLILIIVKLYDFIQSFYGLDILA